MRNYLGAAAAGLLVIALIWLLVSRNNDEAVDQSVRNVQSPASQNVGDHKYPDKAGVHISSITPESGEIGESIQSTNLEPIDIREWRMSHGYYRSDSNDSGSKHPYEYYNIETLEKLAQNGDGLAQIMLGEKLAFSAEHQERSRELYWQAATNGFTAGLSNTATDSMVLKAGSPGPHEHFDRLLGLFVEVLVGEHTRAYQGVRHGASPLPGTRGPSARRWWRKSPPRE